ncbi:hypothetical protein K435DRAFT_968380 [Dendrothele bispora CBS 962.96]|uniref:DUF4470 domain-containing protein n=1 Tax=Dendrothele bispora (strain CBS 962.96) TaxID=1314807 RepID=A0A4S8LPK4_DENBC|nr:hypothetical protein K435DRAFT_968380 [Dendrothele bispora CBS 962.96]
MTSWVTTSRVFKPFVVQLAKSLVHGVRNGTINQSTIDNAKDIVEHLNSFNKSQDRSSELSVAWNQWEHISAERESVAAGIYTAKVRLGQLPIYKKIVNATGGLEFYSVGHDDPMSIIDNWGPQPAERNPMDLGSLTAAQRSRLAFMFAGVGDARHVYGSIIGLHQAYNKLSERERDDLHVHLTLLDIHPTVLVRDLLILVLLDELVTREKSEMELEEIKATIFYTFAAPIMPPACYKRFKDTTRYLLKILQTDHTQLPSWIHIVPSSIPGMIKSLEYWKTKRGEKSTRQVLHVHDPSAAAAGADMMMESFPDLFAGGEFQDMHNEFTQSRDLVSKMPEELVIEAVEKHTPTKCPGPNNPGARAEWLETARSLLRDVMGPVMQGHIPAPGLEFETIFYQRMKAFVPPRRLREEALDDLWATFRQAETGHTPESKKNELFSKARNSIENKWKPNMSLFDSFFDEKDGGSGYPDLKYDVLGLISQMNDCNKQMKVYDGKRELDKDCPSYSVISSFFDAVVDALKAMKGKIQLEILAGDMCQTLLAMKLGTDSSRPESFPRKYLRIWQSNVPDYTQGPLNSALYIAPVLENNQYAGASSNCMLNTGCWKSGDEFCHNFALTTPKDFHRFLGARVKDMTPVFGLITLVPPSLPLPLPISQLASRSELTHWLTKIMLYTIAPAIPLLEPMRARYPNNLTPFFHLLFHLHSVGFPDHWLSQFLSDVISDKVYSTAAPYLGETPIPLSEYGRCVPKRKLHLDPWLPDFELVLSSAYDALPFPLIAPDGRSEDDFHVCSMDEMGRYQAKVSSWSISVIMPNFLNIDSSLSILFRKPGATPDGNVIARKIGDVVEGKVTKRGQIYMQTVVETCDVKSGKIVWRMRKSRFEKMKREGWTLEPIRSDLQESAACRIPAKAWEEASAE